MVGGADTDTLRVGGTSGFDIDVNADGSGTFTGGTASGSFSEIERIEGSEGDDTLDGSAATTGIAADLGGGADTATGGSGADALSGDDGSDSLDGAEGADTLTGGAGDDTLDGGADADVAVFTGAWSDYTITETGGTYTITDNRPGSPDGTDTVTNVETFRFSDGDVGVADVLNDAPSDLTPSNTTIAENSAAGTVVATLSVTDADVGDSHSYAITSDPSGFFEIVGTELRLASGVDLDYETAVSHDVTIDVTDAHGATYSETVTVTVSDTTETIQLGDGGENFSDAGVAESAIVGGAGNDTITGHDAGGTFDGGRWR